ncbi:hypothetical protein [uncultured Kordia sp.]|uniref:hypothetical protein n=1 Tax=uncultured Kordia sp. TaxID=507699 RepID=UPI0026170970|nr:hypothetical protein [uncultured Kordia sp.]
MKKRTTQSLALNKKSISKLDRIIVSGGRLGSNQTTIPVGVCTCHLSCYSCPDCPTELKTAK